MIYGDTSQDGIWYSGDPNAQSGHVFGAKPTIEPVGNAPVFTFPLAEPYQYAGNDIIDASALDGALSSAQLPSIGVVIYGGAGDDTLIGSQTGDIIAGGSGNDTILGERGADLIYGDSGINVDVLTRVLTVPTVNASALKTADTLFAGHDVINGEGLGSAPSTAAAQSDDQDVIFGDHGTVTQDVQEARSWLQAADGTFVVQDTRPQRIQTTGLLTNLVTVVPQNGVGDTIHGDLGNDILFGGAGSDTITADAGNDLVFGDFGEVDATQIGVDPPGPGNPGYRIDASKLPFNVALNDHTFSWTSLYTQATAGWGNDLISGGTGDDILVGGAGSDRVTGDSGDDDIVGGNTGAALAGQPNSGGAGGYNAGFDYSGGPGSSNAVVSYGDTFDGTGGTDGAHSACVTTASCTYGDYLDGGTGNDVIAGDNATILRTGSTASARFRVLTGTDIFDTNTGNANIAGTNLAGGALPCQWIDPTGLVAASCADYGYQADPNGVYARYITLYDQSATPAAGTFSDSDIAGGAGNDVLFGQLGNDWIQGDGSVLNGALIGTTGGAAGHITVDVQTRDTVADSRASVEDQAGPGSDGNDYVEGNGGADVIYGGLGQDDLVGGSSNLFGLTARDQRPDTGDTIYGGANTRVGINDDGDLSAVGHAHDADVVLADNGDIYQLVGAKGSATVDANGAAKPALSFLRFNYDTYSALQRIIPRAYTFLDYTIGAPSVSDIGGPDLVRGEGGDDIVLGELGDDVLFGDGQDDTLIGGTGDDRFYGGTGDDRILGDDGYFNTSRNGLTEPLYDLTTPNATNVLLALPGPYTQALTFQTGELFNEARLLGYNATDPTAGGYADIVYGGLGNDWIHGEGGDDAISGAEALPFYFSQIAQASILTAWGIDPSDPLLYNPTTTKFADYNADDPWSKIYDCTSGQKDVGVDGLCTAGQKVDFFLNFTPYVLDANGTPVTDATGAFLKSNDGCDIIYGDNGNDWEVGGTNTNWLFGGFGDDLLQTSQNLEVDGEHNRVPEPELWSEPVFAFGGAGRDVLIADTGRARLYDWTGEFNSFIVPFSPFGAPVVNRSPSPHDRDFIEALSVAGGQDMTFVPGAPLDETAITTPGGDYWNDQHGGPRDPQPGNTPGVQIDYRGLVDLGANCPCHIADAIVVKGAVNATVPTAPTAAEDAELPPGLVLAVGAPIVLTYLVSNPGSAALRITSIRDDNATPATTADDFTPVYVSGDSNGNGLLDPGEVWLYSAATVAGAPHAALAGGHEHSVTVIGFDPVASVSVGSADPTNYTAGVTGGVQIGKDVNAVDPLHPTVAEQADTAATAAQLPAGAPVVWTYRISTTSTTPVTVVSVTDDNTTPSDPSDDWSPLPVQITHNGAQFNIGDTNFDGLLESGEVWLYTSTGVAGGRTVADLGTHVNVATVVATTSAGSFVATNPAYYIGTSGLQLIKAVNAVDPAHPTTAEDANTGGPSVPVGSTVTFSYVVVNSSGAAMSISNIVDDHGTASTADDASLAGGQLVAKLATDGVHNVGDLNANGIFDAGERWVYLWSTTAALGSVTNAAVVTARNGAGQSVSATDTANYVGLGAHVTLHTAVNAAVPTVPTAVEDANTAPGRFFTAGTPVTFTYLVVNDGPVALVNVVVTDVTGNFHPVFVSGDGNGNGRLDPGETWLYTSAGVKTLTAITGLYSDVSTVVASPYLAPTQPNVTATDPTYYTGTVGGLAIVKAVNAANPSAPTAAEDANNPAAPYYVVAGAPVVFTYLFRSPTGLTVPTTSVVIRDDNGTPGNTADDFTPTYVSGDGKTTGQLNGTEVWLYRSASAAALPGLHCNTVTVTATVAGVTYAAQDIACYFGTTVAVQIKKATNAVNPLAPTVAEEGDDTAHQLTLGVGTPVVWTYRVTNPGNTPVRVTGITDSRTFTPVYVSGDTNGNALLDPGEVWLYTSTGVTSYAVVAGQFLSTATVNAVDPHLGTTATATDVSDHLGVSSSITVRKAVNAVDPLHPTAIEDANNAPGPLVHGGSTVTWTYLVSNTGGTTLDVLRHLRRRRRLRRLRLRPDRGARCGRVRHRRHRPRRHARPGRDLALQGDRDRTARAVHQHRDGLRRHGRSDRAALDLRRQPDGRRLRERHRQPVRGGRRDRGHEEAERADRTLVRGADHRRRRQHRRLHLRGHGHYQHVGAQRDRGRRQRHSDEPGRRPARDLRLG